MKRLSDEYIIEAAKKEISKTGCISGSLVEGRAIAREAERNILDEVEKLIVGGRLGEPEQEGKDVYFLDAKGWQELIKLKEGGG